MGMHMRGDTKSMDKLTQYDAPGGIVGALQGYFTAKSSDLLQKGLMWRIMLDPGLGF